MTVHPIDLWIAKVAILLNPSEPSAAQNPLRALRSDLAEFELTAFTAATARAVASAKRFTAVPAWDIIEPILRQAVRDARPANYGQLSAPPIPDPPQMTDDELARISAMAEEARLIAREAASAMRIGSNRPLRDVSLNPEQAKEARRQLHGLP